MNKGHDQLSKSVIEQEDVFDSNRSYRSFSQFRDMLRQYLYNTKKKYIVRKDFLVSPLFQKSLSASFKKYFWTDA